LYCILLIFDRFLLQIQFYFLRMGLVALFFKLIFVLLSRQLFWYHPVNTTVFLLALVHFQWPLSCSLLWFALFDTPLIFLIFYILYQNLILILINSLCLLIFQCCIFSRYCLMFVSNLMIIVCCIVLLSNNDQYPRLHIYNFSHYSCNSRGLLIITWSISFLIIPFGRI